MKSYFLRNTISCGWVISRDWEINRLEFHLPGINQAMMALFFAATNTHILFIFIRNLFL